MKRTFKLVALMMALFMVFTLVLTACKHDCGDGNHVDANHDGVCDECGKEGLAVAHSGGTATCSKKAVCEVCGQEYGELADHQWVGGDCLTAAKCEVCGEEGSLGAHSKNEETGRCEVCGTLLLNSYGKTASIWNATGLGYEDSKVYTYVDYTSGTQSLNWNPHTWEENLDSTVMAMINVGFYDFVLSADGKAYSVVPELAAYVPGTQVAGQPFSGDLFADVTELYVGRFGVKAGETAKAFRIYLNPNAAWDDAAHTAITAQSYIYSMQQQLDPMMMNRRADSYYGGDFSIVGAKKYLYSATENIFNEGVAYYYDSIEEAEAAGEKVYLNAAEFWGAVNVAEIEGNIDGKWLPWNSEALLDDETGEFWSVIEVVEEFMPYFFGSEQYAPFLACLSVNSDFGYTWDESNGGVGLIAGRDDVSGLEYLDMIIENELRTPEFYVPYYNSSTWLVLESLYEANKVYNYSDGTSTTGKLDESKQLASITSIYCTSVANSVGYGPYSLVSYELDKEIRFERNNSWYGYSDGMHKGQYQMDNYVITVISDHSSAMLAFESGQIDAIGLQSEDMEKYGQSSKLSTTPQTYTTKISFVTDYDALAARQGNGINKTILTVKDFREAISLSVNRSQFVQSLTSGADAGFGLLNYMYVHDVVGGMAYRETDAGKKAIVDLYGLEYGAGKQYATLDAAYQAVTGYDPVRAAQLWESAVAYATTHDRYGKEVAKGSADAIYNGTDRIELQFDVYNSDTIYVQMVNFFNDAVVATTKGTVLEGKISFKLVANADYYDTIAVGETDVIFSTWGGAQFNGLSTISNCYTDDPWGKGNQMEYGFDTSKLPLTIELDLDGSLTYKKFSSNVKNWADWLANRNDEEILDEDGNALPVGATLDLDILQQVFAEVEREYLAQFVAIPIYYRNSVSLDSYKTTSAVDEYVNLVGYGGLRFMTFNFDDTEWAAECAKGLDYTK